MSDAELEDTHTYLGFRNGEGQAVNVDIIEFVVIEGQFLTEPVVGRGMVLAISCVVVFEWL